MTARKVKQFLVIGAGRFGSSVATTLFELGHDVMVVDSREDVVQEISDSVTHAVQADSTSEAALKALGINDFDVVIVAIGHHMQASILTVILLKELGASYVVAKAQTELHGKVLHKLDVERVVFPERDMGNKVAHALISKNFIDLLELSPQYSVVEVMAPREMEGKTLQSLDLRARYDISVISLRRSDGITNISPGAEDLSNKGDIVVAVGNNAALKKMGWI